MTDTKTGAAEARALLEAMQKDRSTEHGRAAFRLLRRFTGDYYYDEPTEREDWMLVFLATAEAASGAGEREAFLAQLRRVNTDRYHAWVGEGQDAGILFDAAELGGEVGELLNVVKKLEREERGWRGSRAAPEDFADECADVLICLDKLARRRGVDLEAASVAKFNATSEKVGLPHKLIAAAPAIPATEEVIKAMVSRFLAWPLPADFAPDNGISATRPNYGEGVEWRPIGTNLLTAAQAEAMIRHLLGEARA